ncbi:hypothetical protein SmJEL517_g02656 [Synchytrium microbalum]|uniref:Uncharacterized protein n=1 Tax=Synchytrium microbalum TaxID=1806994 RepID=A0A507CBE8_9FUNG|nr:uncharacterized protein SmJEL517_g02656 [Synchytrium microbalum]TPX34875.1 hypothetical protein SmJEL517_g02656 [Synchytrium microbalum]
MAALTIVLGTYERLLYGLTVSGLQEETNAVFKPVFIFPAHISALKCVATTSNTTTNSDVKLAPNASKRSYLATGSTDEHIKVFDLNRRREIGTLNPHSGAITRLQFFGKTHLVSSSEDGTIVIYRCKDWEVLKTLKGHTGAVEWCDIHPSGKILISAGRDGTLKVWDLGAGRLAKSLRITELGEGRRGKTPERVSWSPDGEAYAVMSEKTIVVYDVASGREEAVILGIGKLACMKYVAMGSSDKEQHVILTGGEDKMIRGYLKDGTCIIAWNSGHGTRVKDFDVITYNSKTYVASCSSDGGVRLWDWDSVLSQKPPSIDDKAEQSVYEPQPLGTYNADTRLTCISMTLVEPSTTSHNAEEDSEDAVSESEDSDDDDDEQPIKQTNNNSKKGSKPRVSVILDEKTDKRKLLEYDDAGLVSEDKMNKKQVPKVPASGNKRKQAPAKDLGRNKKKQKSQKKKSGGDVDDE